VWRETNNCSGKGTINHIATAERIARGEYCNVTIPPCKQTSGFCDCNGDGKLDATEPHFDCGNETLKKKGVLCADYCPTVCKFTFYSTDDCSKDGSNYTFSMYGAPSGSFVGNYHYELFLKKNGFPSDAYKMWKSIKVNMNGCTLDVFSDKNCQDGNSDQYVSSFTGDMSGSFMNTGGNCTKLNIEPQCVQGNRPCLLPKGSKHHNLTYDFTTTFMTDGGAIKHNDEDTTQG